MVSGEYRIGDIASFICEADRYLLANYNQEGLKFVPTGNPWKSRSTCFPVRSSQRGLRPSRVRVANRIHGFLLALSTEVRPGDDRATSMSAAAFSMKRSRS